MFVFFYWFVWALLLFIYFFKYCINPFCLILRKLFWTYFEWNFLCFWDSLFLLVSLVFGYLHSLWYYLFSVNIFIYIFFFVCLRCSFHWLCFVLLFKWVWILFCKSSFIFIAILFIFILNIIFLNVKFVCMHVCYWFVIMSCYYFLFIFLINIILNYFVFKKEKYIALYFF